MVLLKGPDEMWGGAHTGRGTPMPQEGRREGAGERRAMSTTSSNPSGGGSTSPSPPDTLTKDQGGGAGADGAAYAMACFLATRRLWCSGMPA